MERFVLFGAAHLLVIATLTSIGVALAYLGSTGRHDRTARAALAGLLVLGLVVHFLELGNRRTIQIWHVLPLHLCDMAIFVALFALATKHRLATELLYFWTTTGTLLATLSPALRVGPNYLRFFTYFILHGGVILAAVYLVLGVGLRPRKGAVLRAWLLTNAYALVVLAVDVAFERNYLYLLRKPRGDTLLDLFGPWPVYILVCEVLALVLFAGVNRLAQPSPIALNAAWRKV